jgi:ABC-type branched-subunit amino acid transport system substrate-binding protein
VLVKAVHNAGANPTSASIADALNRDSVALPTGTMTFDSNHQRTGAPIYLGMVENNSTQLLKTING